ncbi:hypothetical protein BU198_13300 [Streptomyces sp. CBMA156]|nr:hypothetical protein [Streptomyces sp. CBMA156]
MLPATADEWRTGAPVNRAAAVGRRTGHRDVVVGRSSAGSAEPVQVRVCAVLVHDGRPCLFRHQRAAGLHLYPGVGAVHGQAARSGAAAAHPARCRPPVRAASSSTHPAARPTAAAAIPTAAVTRARYCAVRATSGASSGSCCARAAAKAVRSAAKTDSALPPCSLLLCFWPARGIRFVMTDRPCWRPHGYAPPRRGFRPAADHRGETRLGG